MEQKKDNNARLDSQRKTGFLLGLVVALSIFYVALQYRTSDFELDIDETLLDDLAEELVWDMNDEEDDYVAIQEQVVQPVLTDNVTIVETMPEITQEVDKALVATATVDVEDYKEPEPIKEPMVNEQNGDEPLNVRIVEQLPEYPGGMSAFIEWLTKNLKYPESARAQKIQGKVVVTFIINKDGTISNAKIAKSVDAALDREAMRVVKLMPKWKPGIQNNEPCRTMFAIPIVFKL